MAHVTLAVEGRDSYISYWFKDSYISDIGMALLMLGRLRLFVFEGILWLK